MSEVFKRPESDLPRMYFSDADQINLDESLYVPEMSIAEVAKRLPKSRVFTWSEEPEARMGDIFVFRWAKVRNIDKHSGKEQAGVEFPDVFMEITSNPQRHTSAKYWYASFVLHGTEKTKFMAYKYGTTTNPVDSLDRDAPLDENVEKSPEQAQAEANVRYLRQRRPGKKERLRKAA